MSYSLGFLKSFHSTSKGFIHIIRQFGTVKPGYKERMLLCDKPKYSLCRKSVDIADYEDKFCILLDGKLLLTPCGNNLVTQSKELAEYIRLEWESQIDKLTRFGTLPLTLLLSRTLDFSNSSKNTHVTELLDSLQTDTLLFYERCEPVELPNIDILSEDVLSKIRPLDLKVLQSSIITPLLESFESHFELDKIVISDTISKCPTQNPNSLILLRNLLDSFETPLVVTTRHLQKSLKSLILPLMLVYKLITPAHALRSSRLEETLEAANWGVSDDFKIAEEIIMKDIHACLLFLNCVH